MRRFWRPIDDEETDEGTMILMQRGELEFEIRVDHYTLMTSESHLSEDELGRRPCAALGQRPRPRVLIAGLGMGYTLRAALDVLPADARVTVAELNPVVDCWCRGPLAVLTNHALEDPRVELRITDVAELIRDAAHGSCPFDAIVLDLYQGTHEANEDPEHKHFGRAALQTTRRALSPGGMLAVWTEEEDVGFESRLRQLDFDVEQICPDTDGPRHVVYLARKGSARE